MSKNQDQISDKNSLKIYTKLDELYSKESINTSIESQYEDFHSKFNYLYKTAPTTIIKIIYMPLMN